MATKNLSLVQRLTAPTSKFFRIIRNVGLCLQLSEEQYCITSDTSATLITVAGYLVVAGGVMTSVAQATVEGMTIPSFEF